MGKRKVMYDGELDLAGLKIPCYVLEDGTRVLSGRGMQNALKIVDDDETGKLSSGTRLARYLNQKSLKPFIHGDKEVGHFEPITCYNGDTKINGYEATILADICDSFLEARKHIKLSSRQEIIANQCEVLIRAFARVGITALIDEATGYQYDREKDELQKILGFYIAEEKRKWEKTFPDELYKQFFRLNGWNYTVNGIKNRPGVIGTWTNQYIYDQLPTGVREELKKRVSKSKAGNDTERMHSHLTEDGVEHLINQIRDTLPLMRIADNFEEFKHLFQKSVERQKGQYELPFDTDEKGHIIEEIDASTLSEHNKSLKKALDFNPNSPKKETKAKKKPAPKLF